MHAQCFNKKLSLPERTLDKRWHKECYIKIATYNFNAFISVKTNSDKYTDLTNVLTLKCMATHFNCFQIHLQ